MAEGGGLTPARIYTSSCDAGNGNHASPLTLDFDDVRSVYCVSGKGCHVLVARQFVSQVNTEKLYFAASSGDVRLLKTFS